MRKIALYAIALLVIAAACKKTEKGEDSRWNSGVKTVEELKVLYPGFKAPLQEQLDRAKQAMEAAKAESDKEARIEKMSSANNALTAGFVNQLKTLDRKKKKISEKAIQVVGKATDKAAREAARQAADSAKRIVAQVEALLKKGATTATEANVIVRKAADELKQADKLLATAAGISKQKQAGKNADKSTAGTAGATGAEPTPKPEQQQWTCEYCDHVNAGDQHTCGNCGAKRGKK